jgi:hypothetical protein
LIRGLNALFSFAIQIKNDFFYYITDKEIMLQTTQGLATTFTAAVQTEDNRIDTLVPSSQIRHLFKFINDMDGSVQYAYSPFELIYDRYTLFTFIWLEPAPDVFTGTIYLNPVGYWKYEVYEVAWGAGETVVLDADHAPATEDSTMGGLDQGKVQGLVTKGILYVAPKDGEEQVQYIEREAPAATNYIYHGQ